MKKARRGESPERRNALDYQLLHDLDRAFNAVVAPLLSGEGQAYAI